MSRLDSFKNKVNGKGKDEVVKNLVGAPAGTAEGEAAAAANDDQNQNSAGIDLSAIAGAFAVDVQEETPKKLKGIYLDEDVLKVYEEQAKLKPRGWGSQLTSDLLRAVFEKQGLLPKK